MFYFIHYLLTEALISESFTLLLIQIFILHRVKLHVCIVIYKILI